MLYCNPWKNSVEQSTLRYVFWLSYVIFRIKKEFFRCPGKKNKNKKEGGMEKKQALLDSSSVAPSVLEYIEKILQSSDGE